MRERPEAATVWDIADSVLYSGYDGVASFTYGGFQVPPSEIMRVCSGSDFTWGDVGGSFIFPCAICNGAHEASFASVSEMIHTICM